MICPKCEKPCDDIGINTESRPMGTGGWYTSEPCGCTYWLSHFSYVRLFPDAPDTAYMRAMGMDQKNSLNSRNLPWEKDGV